MHYAFKLKKKYKYNDKWTGYRRDRRYAVITEDGDNDTFSKKEEALSYASRNRSMGGIGSVYDRKEQVWIYRDEFHKDATWKL